MTNTISIGQLRQNPTAMIREVAQGATYTLTDRGRPVAEIVPHRGSRWRTAAEANAVLEGLGPDPAWAEELEELRAHAEVDNPWSSAG